MPADQGAANIDAWGLKRLFSHALRRWLAGSSKPRDLEFEHSKIFVLLQLYPQNCDE